MSNSQPTPRAQAPAVAPDPFEETLTKREQQLKALMAVKDAQSNLREIRARAARAIDNGEEAVVVAMVAADKIGAYSLIPENVRPVMPVVSRQKEMQS
jgi:hypothetical protein